MSQGTFHLALWRGIQVAVKRLEEELISDEEKVWVAHGLQEKNYSKNSFPYFDGLFKVVGFLQEVIQGRACIASKDTTSKCSAISGCCHSK